jgi:GWxTD domain-containing protein
MRRILATLVLTISIPITAAVAQTTPVQFEVDLATFAYDDGQTLVEAYMAFDVSALPFQVDSSGLSVTLPIHTSVQKSSVMTETATEAPPVWADSVELSFSVPDTSFIQEGRHFIHTIRLTVPPGEYEMTLSTPGSTETSRTVVKRDLLAHDYSTQERVRVSDVTLATSIERSPDRESVFYKNGLSIRPNPGLLYGAGLQKLFYYAEAYNINEAVEDSNYTLLTYIAESTLPTPIAGLQKRTEREVRNPDVILGSFDSGALPSGSYNLHVVLLDADNSPLGEAKKKFFVYNPGIARVVTGGAVDEEYETSIYASMSEQEADENIEYAKIIATDGERRELRRARNLDAKRRALRDFWTKRDPDPQTPLNEYRQEFFSRLQYTKERYSSRHREGWKTDRGQVLLKYGMPSHIDPHHHDRDAAAHEIWEYSNIPGEGRAIFVFADVAGFDEFELIHSSVSGERKSLNWESEIRTK